MTFHTLLILGLVMYTKAACVTVNGQVQSPTEEWCAPFTQYVLICSDDANYVSGDGCSDCVVDAGYYCYKSATGSSICAVLCGDGLRFPSEMCDDGNTISGDGCSNCAVEPDFVCLDRKIVGSLYPRSKCYPKCPKCPSGEYLVSPCDSGVTYPIRCVPCSICGDRQVESGQCTNDQDRLCSCIPGTTPSADGTQCLRVNEIPPTCDWQAWGQWGACGACGGVRTRARSAGPSASVACPSTFLEAEVCATECTGLPYEEEKKIDTKYKAGTAGYGSLSLYAFWSGEGAQLILGKYGLALRLSNDPEGDALQGRFRLTLRAPLGNATQGGDTTTCNPSPLPAVQQAYEEVKNITTNFLVDRRSIDKDSISASLQSCLVSVSIDTSSDTWLVGVIVGPVVGVALVLILGFLYWTKNKPLNLQPLPEAVRWQYEQFQANPSQWKRLGQGSGSFYHKKLDMGSEEFEKLCQVFFDYQGATDDIPIAEAYAVYNPLLISNFINQLEILRARFQKHPDLFKSSQWLLGENADAKKIVNEAYASRSKVLPWNKDADVMILPAVHGTDFTVAKSICGTGFASLSLLDGGWYGRGIYFSTYALYTTPYFENRREPALIISYIISGHSFPVTEEHTSRASLLGSAIKSGFTSHYVVVKENGKVPSADELVAKKIPLYDEIVVPQESQIMPVYVLRLNSADNVAGMKRAKPSKRKSERKSNRKSQKKTTQNNSPRDSTV